MIYSKKACGILIGVAVSLLANACSNEISATEGEQATNTGQSLTTEFVSTYDPTTEFNPGVLTAAYFLGEWCLAELVLMGMIDKPNYSHSFLPEGQLWYQNEPDSDTRYGGNWRLEGDHLFIVSASLSGAQVLKTIAPNEFVVDSKITQTFRRGGCE